MCVVKSYWGIGLKTVTPQNLHAKTYKYTLHQLLVS
jgi:hypothetical protein